MPLFLKILIANAAVVVLFASVAIGLGVRLAQRETATLTVGLALAAAVIVASVVLNSLILWLALRPLELLQETARRVQAGELDARAEMSPLADRGLERLVATFNGMLENAAQYRRRLRDVAARAQRATEDERKRLARELHDGMAQTLAAHRVKLRLARSTSDPDLREVQLDEVSEQLGEAIEEVRRMARALRPPVLDMLGLAAAIETYARPVAETAGLDIELQTSSVAGSLSKEAELALYRIMQEALSNVIRHSGASLVRVGLRPLPGSVQLLVSDDGCGFNAAETFNGDGRGLGLFGMQERAGYLGGHVQIRSVPGSGTHVEVTIPTNEAASHA